MHHLGTNGYEDATRQARESALTIARHIDAHPDLELRAFPDSTLLAFGTIDTNRHDVFGLADALIARGWYMDKQTPPDSIHLTVNASHSPMVEPFLSDLDNAIQELGSSRGTSGSYATTE
jgi:glutamate/tyrosine decarboxylase-like PLP-dependent enzyme